MHYMCTSILTAAAGTIPQTPPRRILREARDGGTRSAHFQNFNSRFGSCPLSSPHHLSRRLIPRRFPCSVPPVPSAPSRHSHTRSSHPTTKMLASPLALLVLLASSAFAHPSLTSNTKRHAALNAHQAARALEARDNVAFEAFHKLAVRGEEAAGWRSTKFAKRHSTGSESHVLYSDGGRRRGAGEGLGRRTSRELTPFVRLVLLCVQL
jgi:methionine-rich copper-binding protein CopC